MPLLISASRCLRFLGLALALGWGPAASTAGSLDIASVGRPALRVFTDRDGLPQNSIEALLLDSKGYLWCATQDGAAYYNGRTWTHVSLPNPQASQWIHSILETSDGSLWFGRDQGGLCRLQNSVWTSFDTREGLPHTRVACMLERKDGTLLAGTSAGLARFAKDRWEPAAPSEPSLESGVLALHERIRPDGKAVLWVGTEKGLGLLEDGHWRWFTRQNGLPHDTVWSILETQDEAGHLLVWAGTSAGLACGDGKTWRVGPRVNGLHTSVVNRILETRDSKGRQSLWLAGEQGLTVREQGQWRLLNTKSGFPNNVVRSLLVQTSPDGVRTVWAGTFGGLVRMVSGTWLSFDIQSGLPDNVSFALGETRQPEAFWLGFLGGGLARFENGKWGIYAADSEVPDRMIMTFLATRDAKGHGAFWVGTRGGGLLKLEDGHWTRYTERDGLPDSWVYSLYERERPNGVRELWAGTRFGAARMVDGHWTSFGDGSRIPRKPVMAFCETTESDGHRQFWIATRGGGLVKESGTGWKVIGTSEGLCDARLTALLETRGPEGHWLWVGTYNGLCRLRLDQPGAAWETLGSERLPALPSLLVYQLRCDARGRVFVFTHRGVARLTPRTPTPQDPAPFDVYTYTTGDGLPSNGCTMGSGFLDHQGRLWTGTVAGAAMLDLSQEAQDRTPKPLLLEHVKLGTQEHPLGQKLVLPWRSPRLSFEFALLSYFREEDTRFRTQLVGLEAQPSEWSPDLKREYSTLPAGTYQFKVWGRDFAGNESGPIQVQVEVRQAPWLTWWALTLEILGGLCLVILAIRNRTRLLRKRNLELEGNVARRTLELQQANEALRNQSLTDPLTGLRNRRYLDACMPEDVAQIQRVHRDMSSGRRDRMALNIDLIFAMVDIDHFKHVNDEHGHPAGDRVLQQFAAILREAMRDSDTVVRWGGEEFLVVARNSARQDCAVVVERIRANVAGHAFDLGDGRTIHCTCSLGFTVFPFITERPEFFDWGRVIDLADQALYAAKRGGRNAWVGIYPTERGVPEILKERLPGDIEGLLSEGHLEVLTSLPHSDGLEWGSEH